MLVTVDVLRDMLLWSSIINIGLLLLCFIMMVLARKWIFDLHSKWFNISEENFNSIIYATLGFYKILVFVFNIIPFIALSIAM